MLVSLSLNKEGTVHSDGDGDGSGDGNGFLFIAVQLWANQVRPIGRYFGTG